MAFPSFLLTRSISSLPVSQPDFLRIRGLYRFVVMQMLQISIHWNKWLGMLRICWVGCFWTDVSGVKSIFIFRYLQLMIRYLWLSGIDGIYSYIYILSSRMGSKDTYNFVTFRDGMTWRHCHLVEPDVNTSTLSTALSTVSLFGLPVGDLKAENAGSGAKESQSTPCFTSWSIACVSYFCLFEFVGSHPKSCSN